VGLLRNPNNEYETKPSYTMSWRALTWAETRSS